MNENMPEVQGNEGCQTNMVRNVALERQPACLSERR